MPYFRHELSQLMLATFLAACSLAACSLGAQEQPTRNHDAWQPYLDGQQPNATELPKLLTQLTSLLGSPSMKLRDDTAYTLLSRWILRDNLASDDQCRSLLKGLTDNLQQQLPEANTTTQHAVLLRSFSALSLALLVARDHQAPYLDQVAFDALVTKATQYLIHEPDERGYDPQLGWVHASAHGADLIRQLAKSSRLQPPQQTALLHSISERLQRLQLAFTASEDDRMAHAVVELVQRQDFELARLRTFLTTLANLPSRPLAEHQVTASHNRRLLVQALLVRLLLAPRDHEHVEPTIALLKQALLGKLRKR